MSQGPVHDPSLNRALVQERARVFLRENGARLTKPRLLILEEIFSSREYFTAEELHSRLERRGGRIAIATIYRLLQELVKGHFLRVVADGADARRFDPNYPTNPSHHHILCKDCGKLIEFEDPCLDLRERALAQNRGFIVDELQVRVDASCERLQSSGNCPNKAD